MARACGAQIKDAAEEVLAGGREVKNGRFQTLARIKHFILI
jgi:hypothetical protein